VPADGLVLENGSGLVPQRTHRAGHDGGPAGRRRPIALRPELRSGLPLAGWTAPCAAAFTNQAAQGRPGSSPARSTTVAVAGYVRDRRERDWVVVAIVNQPEAARHGAQVVDRLVNWVAEQR
jgi:hypothetical protein